MKIDKLERFEPSNFILGEMEKDNELGRYVSYVEARGIIIDLIATLRVVKPCIDNPNVIGLVIEKLQKYANSKHPY